MQILHGEIAVSGQWLRDLAAKATPGPWLAATDADADLMALAPDLAVLAADIADTLAEFADTDWDDSDWVRERSNDLLTRLADLQPKETTT